MTERLSFSLVALLPKLAKSDGQDVACSRVC